MENSSNGTWAFMLVIYSMVLILGLFAANLSNLEAIRKYGRKEFRFVGKFRFAGGLELPQNVVCKVVCLVNRITILSSGQEFSLPIEKIIDVSVMTNQQIQKQYVSSIGGAIAGGLLLGPLGAIIGGSASQKRIKTNTKYLIFTYRDNEQTKYILFDVTKKPYDANRFKMRFRRLSGKESVKIDL